MLHLGKMRHRIEIQVRDVEPTETGEPGYSWSEFATIWSSVEPLLGGYEAVASRQRQARVPTRFRIRYLGGIRAEMRVVWDERWFNITEVQQIDGKRHEMILLTEELVEMPL